SSRAARRDASTSGSTGCGAGRGSGARPVRGAGGTSEYGTGSGVDSRTCRAFSRSSARLSLSNMALASSIASAATSKNKRSRGCLNTSCQSKPSAHSLAYQYAMSTDHTAVKKNRSVSLTSASTMMTALTIVKDLSRRRYLVTRGADQRTSSSCVNALTYAGDGDGIATGGAGVGAGNAGYGAEG